MQITKGLKLGKKTIDRIRCRFYASGGRGVTWREVLAILEEDIIFEGIEERAVDLVKEKIVEEVMEKHFPDIFDAGDMPGDET